jgi:hypothetical protein
MGLEAAEASKLLTSSVSKVDHYTQNQFKDSFQAFKPSVPWMGIMILG